MKTLILFAALLAFGCSAQVESLVEPPTCAPVACEFRHGVCSTNEGMAYRETEHFNDGNGCWFTTATCFPVGTPEECIPADCYEETGLACEAGL